MSEIINMIKVVEMLLHADNILLLCHKNPDGDTVGSAAALAHALRRMGKTIAVFCADPIPARYDYMQIPLFKGEFTPGFVVAIDVAGIQLFGDGASAYSHRVDLCIDHHSTNSGYAFSTFVDSNAAATAEVVYDIVTALGVEMDTVLANCLYTGVATDTGCFKFANTTPRTHMIASALMEKGAEYIKLNGLLFESKSRQRMAIEQTALKNLQFYFDGLCALTYLTREEIENSGADPSDLEGVTGIPRAIEGVKAGITMRQQPSGSYKVSVRTVPEVNASDICAHLGGGGHRQASGCEIIGGLENAKQAILAEVKKHL